MPRSPKSKKKVNEFLKKWDGEGGGRSVLRRTIHVGDCDVHLYGIVHSIHRESQPSRLPELVEDLKNADLILHERHLDEFFVRPDFPDKPLLDIEMGRREEWLGEENPLFNLHKKGLVHSFEEVDKDILPELIKEEVLKTQAALGEHIQGLPAKQKKELREWIDSYDMYKRMRAVVKLVKAVPLASPLIVLPLVNHQALLHYTLPPSEMEGDKESHEERTQGAIGICTEIMSEGRVKKPPDTTVVFTRQKGWLGSTDIPRAFAGSL
ncbi:MAG: hypothetical protein JW834_04160 [Candidatus Diapherotrites archaeon]|nr:hypothetical protein [Candidatus Diapherotrites archaeon]